MRTTLELPDRLLRQARRKATDDGVSLGTVVARALRREVAPAAPAATAQARGATLLAALGLGRNTRPVGRLNREELYARPALR